ncbi:MAG: hypothetical protein IJS99_09710 [Synergistaceae bacterium]|nr:hypothetical protein [Synergistaceae bacterium]
MHSQPVNHNAITGKISCNHYITRFTKIFYALQPGIYSHMSPANISYIHEFANNHALN